MTVYSPNLRIAHLANQQNQPEVPVNDGTDRFDAALTEQISVTVAGVDVDASVDPSTNLTNFLKAVYVKFTGTLTANVNYLLPVYKHLFVAEHAASGNFTVTVKRTGQTGVLLRPGEKKIIYNDGTDARLHGDLTARIGFYQSGKPSSAQIMLRLKAPFAFTMKAAMPGAKITHNANPTTNPVTFSLKRNGGAAFGTVAISSAGAYTLTQAAAEVFAEDDVLTIEGPASSDATLTDVGMLFQVVR